MSNSRAVATKRQYPKGMNFDEAEIQCPHCGEMMSVPIDPSQGEEQEFIEDCAVCCRPISIRISLADEEPIVEAVAS